MRTITPLRTPQVPHKRRAIESCLQRKVVNLWRNLCKPEYRDALFAIPNGGMVTPGYRIRLVNEGLIAGWPDLGLVAPGSHVVWFELKRPTTYKWSEKSKRMIIDDRGGTTDTWQKHVHDMLKSLDHNVVMVTDEGQFLDWLKQNARDMLKVSIV